MIHDIKDGSGNSRPELNSNDPDAEVLGVIDSLQGHVSQTIKQNFKIERRRELKHKKLNLDCREYLMRDQFTNLYCVFVADLIDGERHCVPSFIGSDTRGINKKYRQFPLFNDDMLSFLQQEAWVLFGRQTVAVMKARHAANVATLITTPGSPGLMPTGTTDQPTPPPNSHRVIPAPTDLAE